MADRRGMIRAYAVGVDKLLKIIMKQSIVIPPNIVRVRETLLNEGEVPAGLLRDEIDVSWRRSINYGLSCTAEASDTPGQLSDLESVLAKSQLLLDAAAPEMSYLAKLHQKGGAVILANEDATVLAIEGGAVFTRDSELSDLRPGYCWSESVRGTNALGTALSEARPTLINHGEHYLTRLSRFSCVSVPIKDPNGKVIGVLDVTRDVPIANPEDSLAVLTLASRNIESRLFTMLYPHYFIVSFHQRRQYLDSPWHGLLAIGMDGEIAAANAQACQLLGLTLAQLVGIKCSQLLGRPMERLHQGAAGEISTAQGTFFYKTLQVAQALAPIATRAPAKIRVLKRDNVEELGESEPRLLRALRMAQQGLANGLPILLLGETGTGKEVVARALHEDSERATKPFVAVNCAAIPEGLIESELFGYREGAFTGSRKGGVVGRLMQADGGTLFLDEIGDMPLSLQARLLRVLQERKVAPLGAGEEQEIDVAVICATHRDLKSLVQEKLFREDLYYRVNGLSLRLPPLRERQDLDRLVARLLNKFGGSEVHLDKDLTELFANYDWPGNFRQLEMVLRSALAMRTDGEAKLGLDHLTDTLLEDLTATSRQPTRLRENELEMIRSALERHDGNVSAAADSLGISRATLYRKLKQLRE